MTKAKRPNRKNPFMTRSTARALENPVTRERTIDLLRGIVAFGKETERGCALVVSEWASDFLDKLLRAQFDSEGLSKREADRLLKVFNAPIGSFAGRIAICRAFGLISPPTHDALTAIREIRNHCAHSRHLVSLNDTKIGQSVRVLQDFTKLAGQRHDGKDKRPLLVAASALAMIEIGKRTLRIRIAHARRQRRIEAASQEMTAKKLSNTKPISRRAKGRPKGQ